MHALVTLFLFFRQFYLPLGVRMHALETLFLFFAAVQTWSQLSLGVRMHANLETLFANFSLQFQLVSKTIRIHA